MFDVLKFNIKLEVYELNDLMLRSSVKNFRGLLFSTRVLSFVTF